MTGLRPSRESDVAAAREIFRLLGDLPLAMVRISEFMNDRSYSYEEFLPVYKKLAKRIYASSVPPMQYGHTLDTVWEASFERLSTESKTLLNFLSFFDPDNIPESIMTNARANICEPDLRFFIYDSEVIRLSDNIFRDAVVGLTKASLVSHLSARKALSIHRLVQFTVFSRLTPSDTSVFLKSAIRMLSYSFPNSWNETTNHHDDGWQSWEAFQQIFPHITWLMRLVETHSLTVADIEIFAELIFRAGTYLWEKEKPTTAQSFFRFGLQLNLRPPTQNYAQAYRYLGHIALDLARPKAALSAYQQAVSLREALYGPNSPSVANVYSSIACSYAGQGNVKEAFEYLSKAVDIHTIDDTLLMNLAEKQIMQFKYPKHSGNIILLARIKHAEGLKKEAKQLALQTISIRKGLFGKKGPRVADSMFTVGRMLEEGGEDALAAKYYREIIDMSRGTPEMQGHLARSLWFLAGIEGWVGDYDKAAHARG
ncbi:hypothetical protein AJ79_06307 [Helicocarpus griseus UAMH5409]|uniref:DUF7779 domain-containing protein n=1 Tax=Helicocarpus griseus UAMH5409 TaxID=1447875 RepID=A0A2B7XEP3_9EURO|nr:hypothetical protein AJ79_06307 [Helicocarpus griseus UAMH5409]